jgi:hypothetical protein
MLRHYDARAAAAKGCPMLLAKLSPAHTAGGRHAVCAGWEKRSSPPYHRRTGQQTAFKSMSHSPIEETLASQRHWCPAGVPRTPFQRTPRRIAGHPAAHGRGRTADPRRPTPPLSHGDTRQISQRLDPVANADAAAAGSPGNSESAARVEPRLALACDDPLGLATLMMPAQVGPGPLRMWVSAHGAPSRRRPGLCRVNTSLPTVIVPDRKDGEVTSTGAGRVMAVML